MPERRHSEAIANRMLSKYTEEIEKEYQKGRANSAEELWNALGAVIAVQQPSVETLLYVLEMIKIRALQKQYVDNLGPAARVEVDHVSKIPGQDAYRNGHLPGQPPESLSTMDS